MAASRPHRAGAAMLSRQVASGDVVLAVFEWGDPAAPTVVLVHGYPDTSAVWWPMAERLAEQYHVVAYDVRGAGGSSAPKGTRNYRLERLMEDLGAVIDAVSPDAQVHLVGHDWGSIQGWEAVTNEPLAARVASYTSIYAPGLDHAADWVSERLRHPTPRHVKQLIGQQLRSWYVVAFHLPGASLAWRASGATWPAVQQRVEKLPPSKEYPAATLPADAARGLALYRANFRTRMRHPVPRPTSVPVQVIVPLDDLFVSPALSEGLARWAPRLWRTEMAAGHWAPRAQPELLARWTAELVDHIEGGPESRRLQRSRVSPPLSGSGVDGCGALAAPAATAGNDYRRTSFTGHLVVVTGAGGGIGRAVALAFAARGAAIVAADIDGAAAARTAKMAGALGVEAHHRQVDVGDADAMEQLAGGLARDIGVADIVVNNAGIGMAGPLLDTGVDDWDGILRVNLWGVIHGSRLFGRQMADRGEGGHIVNMASMAAFTPSRSYPAYATTKAAVLMMSECLGAELAGAGIGVHTICPGFVSTGIGTATRYVGVPDAEQDRLRHLAGRFYARALKPEAVADAVLDAVRTGAPVVVVGRWAKFNWALSHLVPGAGRRLAKVDFIPR